MTVQPLDFEHPIALLERRVAELAEHRNSEDPLLVAARKDLEKERKALYGNLTPGSGCRLPDTPHALTSLIMWSRV